MSAQVSGRVTLDGQPLDTGNVAFVPVHDGPASTGSIDSSGYYRLNTGTAQGVVPGEYRVAVVATKPPPPPDPRKPPQPPELLTPSKYARAETSDLRFVVKAGSQTIDLSLTAAP